MSTPQQSDNLTALRMQYKHKRMQSKNALVNHYRSLSLMAGDDFSKILNKPQPQDNKDQQDFDDISSIYTAHNNNNNVLENTLKRVRDRDLAMS